MKNSFKPLTNLHLNFLFLFYICPIIPLDIGCMVVCFKEFNFTYFIICLILTLLPICIYLLIRIFYPYKYVVDDKYLVKLRGKEILLKIKISEIKAVIINKKLGIVNYIKFVISLILYYKLSTKNVTTVAFIFDKYEVLTDYNYGEFERLSINEVLNINGLEYVEILGFMEIKKLQKILRNVTIYQI